MRPVAYATRVFPSVVRLPLKMSPPRFPFLLPRKRNTLPARLSTSAAAGCFNRHDFSRPMKALTAAEMREVDRLTIERHGISGAQLMENAGSHVADHINKLPVLWRLERPVRVVIFCGKGNNGGDGFVVARRLAKIKQKFEVRVFLFGEFEELQGDARTNARRWKKAGGLLF